MRRLVMMVVGAALALSLVSPAMARQANKDATIQVNGTNFEGKWAIIGERPYVGVESFAKALGLPRIHNVKDWQLAQSPSGPVNPLELVVRGPKSKLPTVRHAGATMVDLKAACADLDIPLHYNFYSRVWQVGSPYKGEFLKGAWYRWLSNSHRWYQVDSNTGYVVEGDHMWWLEREAEFPSNRGNDHRL